MADTNADFFKLTLKNSLDQTLNLSDMARYLAEESDGFGMAPLARLRESAPNIHGEIDTGFRLLPRKLKFKIKARGTSPADVYARRNELLKYFSPSESPLTLIVSLPDGSQRAILCHLESGLSFNSGKRSGYVQEAEIVLNCPNPAFYDPDTQVYSYHFQAGESSHSLVIPYTGTWRAFPLIGISGPITNPVLTHPVSGDTLSLNCTIPSGEQVFIYLDPMNRKIEWNGVKRMDILNSDSDFITFHIENLYTGPGQVINLSGSGITTATLFTVQFDTQYIGI
jgi:hypothetical protein